MRLIALFDTCHAHHDFRFHNHRTFPIAVVSLYDTAVVNLVFVQDHVE